MEKSKLIRVLNGKERVLRRRNLEKIQELNELPLRYSQKVLQRASISKKFQIKIQYQLIELKVLQI